MWFTKARRERELVEADQLRMTRRVVDGDATAFGQELTDVLGGLPISALDERLRRDYQSALDHHHSAIEALAAATTTDAVFAVDLLLRDGRFHLACVLAGRDGTEPPRRRDPCFFDLRHGPAVTDVSWTPPGLAERMVAVCRRDQHRLAAGEEPDTRLVRVGDRWIPWHEVGSVAYVAQHHSHAVRRGASTALTDGHVAEAHLRSTTNGGMNAPGGGPFG